MDDKQDAKRNREEQDEKFPGYPHYPASQDIIANEDRLNTDLDGEEDLRSPSVADIDADNRLNNAVHNDDMEPGMRAATEPEDDLDWNEKSFDYTFTGDDLDVPGGELDDEMEEIGEEDEENIYYSLGGDRHEDLEEDND